MARTSLHEVEVILDIARDLCYITEEDFVRLTDIASETGRTLHGYYEMVAAKAAELKRIRRKRAAASATALAVLLLLSL